jgi:hypothetical protein
MNKKVQLFEFENFSVKKVKSIGIDSLLEKHKR